MLYASREIVYFADLSNEIANNLCIVIVVVLIVKPGIKMIGNIVTQRDMIQAKH